MWDVSGLYGLTGMQFEIERNRIISGHILSLPEKHRKAAYTKQIQIDMHRISKNDAEFNAWLAVEIKDNLENLSDQLIRLKNIIDGPPRTLLP